MFTGLLLLDAFFVLITWFLVVKAPEADYPD